jgi:hypothetical protein
MQNRMIVYPEDVRAKHVDAAKEYLVKERRFKVERQAPKIKGLRRKLSELRPKPVPDVGLVYERTNQNGTIRRYKVQPNGEWRRVKE